VAPAPFMLSGAKLAIVVAKAGAQTLSSRHWASVICLHVGWWFDSMLIEDVKNVAVGTVVQFLCGGFLTMFVGEVVSIFLMSTGQNIIPDLFYPNHSWIS